MVEHHRIRSGHDGPLHRQDARCGQGGRPRLCLPVARRRGVDGSGGHRPAGAGSGRPRTALGGSRDRCERVAGVGDDRAGRPPAGSAPSATPTERPAVVVCCPEGEAHELAAEMVAEVLRSRGWPVDLLGATVPAADVRAYLDRRKPTALMVSCTTPCGLPGAARMVEAAHDVGVPTLVGGAGFGRDNLRALRLGAAAWAPTVTAGIAVLEEWRTAPPLLPPGGALNDDYLDFEGALPEIRAGAVAALRRSEFRRRDDMVELASTNDGIEVLLRHIEAAVLVDDERVLLDYLSWGTAYLRAREASTSRLAARLDAVANEIPATPARAGRFVQDGMRHLEWNRRPGSGNPAVRTRPSSRRRPGPTEVPSHAAATPRCSRARSSPTCSSSPPCPVTPRWR